MGNVISINKKNNEALGEAVIAAEKVKAIGIFMEWIGEDEIHMGSYPSLIQNLGEVIGFQVKKINNVLLQE